MRLLVLGLVGCGFNAKLDANLDASVEVTADAALDASPDATVLPVCNLGVMTTPVDRGRVGGNGGGDNPARLACTGDERIVGIAVRMSNQNTIFNARSAHAMQVACATVSWDPNTSTGTTGTPRVVEVSGSGAEMWSPSTLTAMAMCPPGTALQGVQVRTGPNMNLFNNVWFRCLAYDGTAITIGSPIYVQGSLNEAMNVDTQNCGNNELVVEMSTRTGSGFDSANLFCSQPRCL